MTVMSKTTSVVFFEKPGCINNTKQKRILGEHGYEVEAKDLLAEPWTAETLRPFFGDKPLAAWLNPAAPKVKSGEVSTDGKSEQDVLALLISEPILIRRPLIKTEQGQVSGFEPGPVLSAIGLEVTPPDSDVVTCPRSHGDSPDGKSSCSPPKDGAAS